MINSQNFLGIEKYSDVQTNCSDSCINVYFNAHYIGLEKCKGMSVFIPCCYNKP